MRLAVVADEILNKTDLAAPLGVSVPTLTQWLSILEITGQIILVPPYFEERFMIPHWLFKTQRGTPT